MKKSQVFSFVFTVFVFSSVQASLSVAPKDALCGLNDKSFSVTYFPKFTVDIPLCWLLDPNGKFQVNHTRWSYLKSSARHQKFFQELFYKLKEHGYLPQDYKEYIVACKNSGHGDFLRFDSSELEVVHHFALKSISNLEKQFCWSNRLPFIKSTGPEGLLPLKNQQPEPAQALPVLRPEQSQNSLKLNPQATSFVPQSSTSRPQLNGNAASFVPKN